MNRKVRVKEIKELQDLLLKAGFTNVNGNYVDADGNVVTRHMDIALIAGKEFDAEYFEGANGPVYRLSESEGALTKHYVVDLDWVVEYTHEVDKDIAPVEKDVESTKTYLISFIRYDGIHSNPLEISAEAAKKFLMDIAITPDPDFVRYVTVTGDICCIRRENIKDVTLTPKK